MSANGSVTGAEMRKTGGRGERRKRRKLRVLSFLLIVSNLEYIGSV